MSATPMTENNIFHKESIQQKKMESYYRFQSKIYDLTRWSFLFGRKEILDRIPKLNKNATILEVGCGTGYNLKNLLGRFPQVSLTGIDISATMLEKAARKIKSSSRLTLTNEAYGAVHSNTQKEQVDVILFSYTLSMINPHWPSLIDQAKENLKPGGYIALVDFENSKFKWFKKHMANNHVRMDGHIVPYLEKQFRLVECETKNAYAGVWSYFMYIGQKI